MNPSCGSCRFFARNETVGASIGQGFCHRNPPQVFIVPGANGSPKVLGQWPPVAAEQFCGEYQPVREG